MMPVHPFLPGRMMGEVVLLQDAPVPPDHNLRQHDRVRLVRGCRGFEGREARVIGTYEQGGLVWIEAQLDGKDGTFSFRPWALEKIG